MRELFSDSLAPLGDGEPHSCDAWNEEDQTVCWRPATRIAWGAGGGYDGKPTRTRRLYFCDECIINAFGDLDGTEPIEEEPDEIEPRLLWRLRGQDLLL